MEDYSVRKLYQLDLQTEKSILYVKAYGFFRVEDTKGFMSEFQTILNTINPANYKLIIDLRELEAMGADVLDDIRLMLNVYSIVTFKKAIIIRPTSVLPRMQIENTTKEVRFKGVFINSLEEANNL